MKKGKLIAVLVLALVVGSILVAGPALAYQRFYATVDGLALRSGPGTSYSLLQRVNRGTPLDAACASLGTNVLGDSVWLKLTGGQWVADYYTTSDGWGTRFPTGISACSSASSSSTRASRAVAWFAARNGSRAYEGLCEKATEAAYGTTGRYPSANAAWSDAVRRGLARTSGTPNIGALVFWSAGNPYGHTGVYAGSGTFWATSVRGAIGRASLPYYSGYRGWVPAGTLY